MLAVAKQAAEAMAVAGVSAQVVSLHTVKPLDEPLLEDCFGRFLLVVVVEEHSRLGGAGSAVAEWLVARPMLPGKLLALGTADCFPCESGSQEFFRERFGLTAASIARQAMELYARLGQP